jgi:Fic family protein
MFPSSMEPMLPSAGAREREARALELVRSSAALGAHLHPLTREALVERLRRMNSYYSNLLEGHETRPIDIDRALESRLARDPQRRMLQLESAAHVEVQRLVDARLAGEPRLDVTHRDFLSWLHREFYERVPSELRELSDEQGRSHRIVPGELRQRHVSVGRHVPPDPDVLPAFLARFQEAYGRLATGSLEAVAALGPAHHRLVWIHPFLDGNGRVARLFTDAWLRRHKVDGHGLWTMSRGWARHRDGYLSSLAEADEPRRGDFDGRGALSDASLGRFADRSLDVALDQVSFVAGLLELDRLRARIEGWATRRSLAGELRVEAARLVVDLLSKGEVPRGEAGRIMGMPDRTARVVTAQLTRERILWSVTPKSALRLAFPVAVSEEWFPRLYPAGGLLL